MLQLARNHGPSVIYVDALHINGDAPKKEDPRVLEQRGAVRKTNSLATDYAMAVEITSPRP